MPRDHKIQIVIRDGNINARVTWMENGKRKALWRSGSTKTEARDRLREALKERETRGTVGRYGPNAKFSVVMQWYLDRYAVAPVYVDDRKVSGLRSSGSVRGYARALNAFFEDRGIGSVYYSDLESYKAERLRGKTKRGKGRSLASVHRELALLRRLFNIAEREGWIAKSPFRKGESLISVAQERKGTRVLSREEETRLLATCTGRIEHLRAILICAIDTGMRAGEIFSLKWGDVERTKIRIPALITKTMQTRTVPVSDRLRLEFKALWEQSEQDNNKPVFGITTVKRAFKTACSRAGIEHGEPNGLSFRCLRRTAATRLIQAGLSREEVSKILGHSEAQTTYQHYLSADDNTLNRAREILDRINQSGPPSQDVELRAKAGTP
jgi:integrase